jgi:PilZ domain-containing protein
VSPEKAASEGRRSPRIVAGIPLELRPVEESFTAVTAVINLHGALILSPLPWPSGTILQIQNQKNKRSIRARVVWTGPQETSGSCKLGVEFETPESGFWGDDYRLKPVQIAEASGPESRKD